MAFLKDDGSLDVDRYINLPFEQFLVEFKNLTQAQKMEYEQRLHVYESSQIRVRKSRYSFDEAIKKGIVVDAKDFLSKMRIRHENK